MPHQRFSPRGEPLPPWARDRSMISSFEGGVRAPVDLHLLRICVGLGAFERSNASTVMVMMS